METRRECNERGPCGMDNRQRNQFQYDRNLRAFQLRGSWPPTVRSASTLKSCSTDDNAVTSEVLTPVHPPFRLPEAAKTVQKLAPLMPQQRGPISALVAQPRSEMHRIFRTSTLQVGSQTTPSLPVPPERWPIRHEEISPRRTPF